MRYVFLLLMMGVLCLPVEGAEEQTEWQIRTQRAQEMDIGESAPDWLVNSETYLLGCNPGDWEWLAESKVSFITHCPVNRGFFACCHAQGIRCFPYVTFYQGFATMTYQGVNLKDHAEFIEVNAEGNLVRSGFWESEDAKNMYTTCPNVQAYQDAMVAWVEKLMALGADGVFVDNLSNRTSCEGPKFGKHTHLYDDQNHAFAMLLKRVREVIKRYQPEGAILGNSAYPPSLPKEYWKYLDAEMLESYICTWVSTDRWFDWDTHWNKVGKDLQPYIGAGKQIQALSYLGHTAYGIREDALFCYATARLAGFVWNGGLNANTIDLYQIRLGKPRTEELEQGCVHYRVFERGFVAVNPDRTSAAQWIPDADFPGRRVLELAGQGALGWDPYGAGGFRLDSLTKHSGDYGLYCENVTPGSTSGANQMIPLNQVTPQPLRVCGWSKAEEVSGNKDADYAVYADITYTDGTNLFGQTGTFDTGSHDWQSVSFEIQPEKPVQRLCLYALFRNHTGRVWFDDFSLTIPGSAELLRNPGFNDAGGKGRFFDLSADKPLTIPAYSGRVYLFAPETADDLAMAGPRLTVSTRPALGAVRFRVDGFDYWTYSGRWTTEYVLGPQFGTFEIRFDGPGPHTVAVVDTVPADMNTPSGYGSGNRLGTFMDPSNPTQPSEGKKFQFRRWEGYSSDPGITIEVSQDTCVTAQFDITAKTP